MTQILLYERQISKLKKLNQECVNLEDERREAEKLYTHYKGQKIKLKNKLEHKQKELRNFIFKDLG